MAGAAALALSATIAGAHGADTTNWLANTISPVSNPIFFEDPNITSEVRPIYMFHVLPDNFQFNGGQVKLGGQVQVTALQLRYAVTDRLAIIATKDGYIEFQPDHTLAHHYGFADIGAGLKYALVDDKDHQILVTPGFTFTAPTGSHDSLQGYGSGEWNAFVSAEKGLGLFHLTGNLGFRVPDNFAEQTAQMHYSLQLDMYTCQYFIPFLSANGYTVLSRGDRNLLPVSLNTEMYDLINSGSTEAYGTSQVAVGCGFRTRILKDLDAGFSYEAGVSTPVGIFEDRITADVIWRF